MSAKTKLSNAFSTVKYGYMKHRPVINLVIGLAAGAGCIVAACSGTIKAEQIVAEYKETDKVIEKAKEIKSEEYTEKQYKKDKIVNKIHTVGKTMAYYAPAVVLGGLSVAALLCSYAEMHSRNESANAAANMFKNAYNKLSGAVKDEFGEEKLNELIGVTSGTKTDIESKTLADGTVVTEEKEVPVTTHGELLGFQRYFSESRYFIKHMPDANEAALKQFEITSNQQLVKDKFITFNDVLDICGFDKVKAGIYNGWVLRHDAEHIGDNAVKISVTEVRRPLDDGTNDTYIDYLLTFNLDGDITGSVNIAEV